MKNKALIISLISLNILLIISVLFLMTNNKAYSESDDTSQIGRYQVVTESIELNFFQLNQMKIILSSKKTIRMREFL